MTLVLQAASTFDGEQPNRTIADFAVAWAENANADDNEDCLLDEGGGAHWSIHLH